MGAGGVDCRGRSARVTGAIVSCMDSIDVPTCTGGSSASIFTGRISAGGNAIASVRLSVCLSISLSACPSLRRIFRTDWPLTDLQLLLAGRS